MRIARKSRYQELLVTAASANYYEYSCSELPLAEIEPKISQTVSAIEKPPDT
jgi:hypothetical protein